MEDESVSSFCENSAVSREDKLIEFKKLILDDNISTRNVDWFLDRFLSLGRQNPLNALHKLQKYENFRKKYKDDWLIVNIVHIREVLASKCIVVLDGCDKKGRKIIWIRLGKWEPENYASDTILQVAGLIAEIHLIMNKFKSLSAIIIFDMEDFGLKQLNALNSKFAKKMVHYMSECAPLEISSIFVLRESKLFSLIYSCFKPFLDDKMKKNIQLFGQDLISLQEHVNIDNLPAELGGSCENVTTDKWIQIIETEHMKSELIKAGYVFLM